MDDFDSRILGKWLEACHATLSPSRLHPIAREPDRFVEDF
jgi:hypothetical protein